MHVEKPQRRVVDDDPIGASATAHLRPEELHKLLSSGAEEKPSRCLHKRLAVCLDNAATEEVMSNDVEGGGGFASTRLAQQDNYAVAVAEQRMREPHAGHGGRRRRLKKLPLHVALSRRRGGRLILRLGQGQQGETWG